MWKNRKSSILLVRDESGVLKSYVAVPRNIMLLALNLQFQHSRNIHPGPQRNTKETECYVSAKP